PVGHAFPLASLTTDADATIGVGGGAHFNMSAPSGPNPAGVNAVSVTINDAIFFKVDNSFAASPSVQSTGDQIYVSAASLQKDTVLGSTSGGTIWFKDTLDGGL